MDGHRQYKEVRLLHLTSRLLIKDLMFNFDIRNLIFCVVMDDQLQNEGVNIQLFTSTTIKRFFWTVASVLRGGKEPIK